MDSTPKDPRPKVAAVGTMVHRLFDDEQIEIEGGITVGIRRIGPSSAHVTVQAPKFLGVKITRRPPSTTP